MLRWRIYYADRSTRSDMDTSDLSALPPLGVGLVVQADEAVGRVRLHHKDFYLLLTDGVWVNVDQLGLLTYITTQLHRVRAVCCGVMLPEKDFAELLRLADLDEDFPPKSASCKADGGR